MPNFRRGAEHIQKAQESSGGGNFKPFLPNIYWKDDGEERYILILNPIEEIPMVSMQKPFTSEGRAELVVARTDEAIGERFDPLEKTWGYGPQELNVCVAVELEPEFELVKGRKRPVGFTVKTRTFDRKIYDEKKKEYTDEKEEVTVPILGLIAQSPFNFFNHVASQDANKAPIHECATLVRRLGTKTDTSYEVEVFDDKEVDLSGLLDFIEDVNYLNDEMDDLIDGIEAAESDQEAAMLIGSVVLDKRLNELADSEYYDSVFELVDAPARYPVKGWKKGGKDEEEKKDKPSRTSQRRSRRAKTEEAPAESGVDNADEVDPPSEETEEKEAPAEEAPKTSRRRSRSRSSDTDEPAKEEKTEKVSKSSPVRARLAELQAKAEAKAAAKAEEAA